jgi:hypothetical protein
VVVDAKYGSAWGGWCSNEVHRLFGRSYGRISGAVWGISIVILDLRSVIVLILDSCMICCVGIRLLR